MTDEQKDALEKGLTPIRDDFLRQAEEARKMKTNMALEGRQKHADFLQKLGELSFTFGGAIVPVLIISNTANTVSHLPYVLAGLVIYLANGVIALWKVKSQLEQDADDTPLVGIDAELTIYPIVNALNKWLSDLDNEDHKNKYLEEGNKVVDRAVATDEAQRKQKVSFWLDIAIFNFVIASLLVARAVWQYSNFWYWFGFGVVVLLMLTLMSVSYKRAIKNQRELQVKRIELQKIKSEGIVSPTTETKTTRKK